MTDYNVLPENWKLTPDANGWVPDPELPVWIVCAANRNDEGLIFCGSRHNSNAMRTQMHAAQVRFEDTEQGFVDRYDRWWDRKQAYAIMIETGQPMRDCGELGEVLYSENLY